VGLARSFKVVAAGGSAGLGALGERPPGPLLQACQLVLLLTAEQVDQAALHALALEERVVDLLRDGHLDTQLAGHLERRTDRVGALGDARGENGPLAIEESDSIPGRFDRPNRITYNPESRRPLEFAGSRASPADTTEQLAFLGIHANLGHYPLEHVEIPVRSYIEAQDAGKADRRVFEVSDPCHLEINGPEIKQVVLNLVSNALESMEAGGTLRIDVSEGTDHVEIAFADDGCGMTPEVLENLFEPFFTQRRDGKGTGLGMSISHRIVNDHGGTIEASSEGPGRGSTIRVHLPRRAAVREAA
jgi:signal transduction histidine kinase